MCITSISLNGLQMGCWLPSSAFVPQLMAQRYTPDSIEALCVFWMSFYELISKYQVETQFEVKDTKPLGLYSYHGFQKSGVNCIQLRKKIIPSSLFYGIFMFFSDTTSKLKFHTNSMLNIVLLSYWISIQRKGKENKSVLVVTFVAPIPSSRKWKIWWIFFQPAK